MAHLIRRCWHGSQGHAGKPVDGDPTESGVSKPLCWELPGQASGWALPWRLEARRNGLGAMAMGADLERALGVDMVKV